MMKHTLKGIWMAGMFSACAAAQAVPVVWEPTSNSINTFVVDYSEFFGSPQPVQFAIFDDTDTGFLNPLYIASGAFEADTILTQQLGSDWLFTNDSDMLLVSDGTFVFAASYDSGATWMDPNHVGMEDSDYWSMTFVGDPDRRVFYAADVRPVPVPPAAWLFGSGLIGLAGVARRRR